jgi:hypothetical protein
MRNGTLAALLVVALIIGIAFGAVIFPRTLNLSSTQTTTVSTVQTTTLVSTTTLPATYVNKGVFIMNVNGSFYYADDVSSDIEVDNPGYAHFHNASVTFDGVKFETICPQEYSGCPEPAGNKTVQTQVWMGVYEFNMTFPNGTTETTQGFIGDSTYTFALSNHASPRAGILIEYIEYNYPNNLLGNGPYHTFLLVSPCGPFGCDISTTTVHSGQTP